MHPTGSSAKAARKKPAKDAKSAKTAKPAKSAKAPKAEKAPKHRKSSPPKAVELSAELRRDMIEQAAYFRAEQRGFEGGDPVADWLLSEQEIENILAKGAH